MDKVINGLRVDCHGEGVIRMLQAGDEDLVGYYFPSLHINIAEGVTRKINQEFVRRGGAEHHRGITSAYMLSQMKTKLAVTVTVGMFRSVFLL